jgi:hypothetical protein
MKLLFKDTNQNLIYNPETDIQTNAGWEENFSQIEEEILVSLINPVENYETVRFIHEPYNVTINGVTVKQPDIWFYFYFLNGSNTYDNGLNYDLVGISPKENAKMLKQTVNSFFRLEFYTTPDTETQKMVMAKNLSLPLGQKVMLTDLMEDIFLPVFTGNNYRNSENMYLFWFPNENLITGNTFYMTARFLNAEDGSVVRFLNNTSKTIGPNDKPSDELYYQVVFDKALHTYRVYQYDATSKGVTRKGSYSTPINFYELST